MRDHIPEDSFGAPFGALSTYINYHPRNGRGYEMRAMFNLFQKKQSDAKKDFQKALELQPALKAEIDYIIARLRN